MPDSEKYFNSNIEQLFHVPLISFFKNVFWMVDGGNAPMAFQLWFLRDLIIIIAFTPLLYYFFKYTRFMGFLLIFSFSFVPVNNYITFDSIIPTSLYSSFLWFSFGGVVAVTKSSLTIKKPTIGILVFLIYIFVSILEHYYGFSNFLYFQKLIILSGIIGIWFVYDIVFKPSFNVSNYKWLEIACSFTFFIYLFHEPILNIVRKLIVILLGKNSLGYLISYLFSPILFAFIAILVGLEFRKRFPKIYSNLVGGRV
jgi:hypothetical protein